LVQTTSRSHTRNLRPPLTRRQPPAPEESTFGQIYLRLVTTELASDLDAIRKAPDFKDDSTLPILIRALRQGETLFSADEKRRIVAGAQGSSS